MGTNTFIGNIALLLLVLMANAATVTLEFKGPGCKSRTRYLAGATTLTDLQLLSLIATRLSPT
jgi:hypothetical protein